MAAAAAAALTSSDPLSFAHCQSPTTPNHGLIRGNNHLPRIRADQIRSALPLLARSACRRFYRRLGGRHLATAGREARREGRAASSDASKSRGTSRLCPVCAPPHATGRCQTRAWQGQGAAAAAAAVVDMGQHLRADPTVATAAPDPSTPVQQAILVPPQPRTAQTRRRRSA